MLILQIIILYIDKSGVLSPIRPKTGLYRGGALYTFIKQGAFTRKSKKEEALYIIKGNDVLILTYICIYDNINIYILALLELKPVLDLIGDSKKGGEK